MNKSVYIPRGLPFALLNAIPTLGTDACGVSLAQRINKDSDQTINPAQVYLALKRLNAKGMLNSKDKKTTNGQGRPRRVYSLSQDGKLALDAAMKFYGMNGKG